MAQPNVSKFSELVFKIGDGATPEVFSKLWIAMVSRTWSQTISTNTVTTPDLDDEDLVVDEVKIASTRTCTASGKGKVGKDKIETLEGLRGITQNYQVYENGVGTWTGPFVLTQINRTGERANTWEIDFTLDASGKVVFAPAP